MSEQIHPDLDKIMGEVWRAKITPEDCAQLLLTSIDVLSTVFDDIADPVSDNEKFLERQYRHRGYFVFYQNQNNRYKHLHLNSHPENETREDITVIWKAKGILPARGKISRFVVYPGPNWSCERSKNTLGDLTFARDLVNRFAQRLYWENL